MDIGKAIRIARAVRNLSQSELAAKVGVNPSYMSMLERGERRNPNADTLASITKALGISMHLFTFLGAEKRDLKLISVGEAEALGAVLLQEIAKAS